MQIELKVGGRRDSNSANSISENIGYEEMERINCKRRNGGAEGSGIKSSWTRGWGVCGVDG